MSASSPHITLDDAREVERQVDKLIAEAPQLSHEHFAIDALGQLFAVSETLASLLEQLETLQFECESLRHKLDDAYHMPPGSMARHWEEESKRLRIMLDAVLPEKTTFHVMPEDSEVELRVIDGAMPGHHIPIQPGEFEGSNPAERPS